MLIFFAIIATLSGLGVIISMVTKEASPDAGFSAAMGGGGGGGHRKGGKDELLDRTLKISAVVWLVSCLVIGWLEAHPNIAGTLGS